MESHRQTQTQEYKGYTLVIVSGQYDSSPHQYFADCEIRRGNERIHAFGPHALDPVLIGKPFEPQSAEEAIAQLQLEVAYEARAYINVLANQR